jgi:hypothetical protein
MRKLTAIPQAGYQFAGWHGALETLTNPVTFSADSNMAITAQFVAAPPPTLSVTVTGSGTVTRTPDQASYTPGTTVTLNAIPATDWLFDGWTGDVTAGATPIGVLMDRSKTVGARFRPNGVLVTADAVGPGSVTRSPDRQVYPLNSTLDLRAIAVPGGHFMDWQGDTLCNGDSLTLTLTRDRTLHARFGYQLTHARLDVRDHPAVNGNTRASTPSDRRCRSCRSRGRALSSWAGSATRRATRCRSS